MLGKTLRELEFDRVLQRIADCARSAAAKEAILEWQPEFDYERSEDRLDLTEELNRARSEDSDYRALPLSKLCDLSGALDRARSGLRLEEERLKQLRGFLTLCKRTGEYKQQLPAGLPRLDELLDDFDSLASLHDDFQRIFTEDFEVRDGASAELSEIRNRRIELDGQLRRKLETHAKKLGGEASPVIRSDRFALSVEHRKKDQIEGRVLEVSGGGGTVLIEPDEVSRLNNERIELIAGEQSEVQRILSEFSEQVAAQGYQIERNAEILEQLDIAQARAFYSGEIDGSRPRFSDEPVIDIDSGRFPLVEDFVPEDVHIGPDHPAAIISGVNAGGKTVLMKMVGAQLLMALLGCFVPAGEVTLGKFANLFADVLEEHSTKTRLSAFTSHLDFLMGTLAWLDERDDPEGQVPLVLIDEIGTGTEPGEGAALARSIVDTLVARHTKLMVTTHYEDLKALAIERDDVLNLAMEFDTEKLEPTFRVMHGVPGRSYAMEIAERFGVPDEIIDKARSAGGEDQKHLEEVIRKLEDERRRRRQAADRAERTERELEQKKEELEERIAQLKGELRKQRSRAERRLKELARDFRNEAEQIVQESPSEAEAEKRLNKLRERMEENRREEREQKAESLGVTLEESGEEVELRPGMRVRVAGSKTPGKVVSVEDDQVEVSLGHMQIKADPSELEVAGEIEERSRGEERHEGMDEQTGQSGPSMEKEGAKSMDAVDLHGLTRQEAAEKLEELVDRALLQGLDVLHINHGVGTGVLKNFVRQWLRDHPDVSNSRPAREEEGGQGVTVAEIG